LEIADGAAAGAIDILVTVPAGTAIAEDAFTILAPSNTAPLAVDDSYTMNEGENLSIGPPGVLVNDVDADSDPLTATLVTDVTDGWLTFNADGSFLFDPGCSTGTMTFTYTVSDGVAVSAPATVTVTVRSSLNPAPCAAPAR
jgi:hypothetical protein